MVYDKGATKSLSNKKIQAICDIILEWDNDKLTWQRLTRTIEEKLDLTITRQTLSNYFAIKKEYQLRKAALKNIDTQNRRTPLSVNEYDLLEENKRLKDKIAQLQRKVDAQLDAIQCMIDNAQRLHPRIDIKELIAPLPKTVKE